VANTLSPARLSRGLQREESGSGPIQNRKEPCRSMMVIFWVPMKYIYIYIYIYLGVKTIIFFITLINFRSTIFFFFFFIKKVIPK
jgi:hypothetical protein